MAKILEIDPPRGIPGGEIAIKCEGLDTSDPASCFVWFADELGSIVGLSSKRLLAIVPEVKRNDEIAVRLESQGVFTESTGFLVAEKLAEDLHPVANPAFNPEDGSLFVTRSGSRGEHLPVSLFQIELDGTVTEFSGDIANPTSIAFDQSGQMYVSSRLDGVVYRVTPFKEAVPFANNLGIATGLAFDQTGTMYVGDRSGTIYKVNDIGEEQAWVQIEPSVSAYHLAFGPDGALYVAGPTVTSFESIYRIDENREVTVFYRGLGRPQGLAFDESGSLYVAASLAGRRGIVRISPDGKRAELFAAGVNLVGLAFSPANEMVVVSTDSVYRLAVNIRGYFPHVN